MKPNERRRMEELAIALREREVRDMRRRHRSRGGLIHFIRDFWPILEPTTPFVDGWPLWAMCMHLEAVTRGDITRLLINVPPGSTKSMVVNVFWPAWEWTAMNRPGERYVSFSYAAYLTERDNQRFLDLLSDPRFRAVWPIALTERGKVKVSNSGKGWKFASSVGGVGTGERGSRILCFPEDALVATEQGSMPIGRIVRERLGLRVWSMDTRTGRLELRPVTAWRHNPGSPLVKVNLSDGGSIRCTQDHRIWTQRGWVAAADLRPASCGMILAASGQSAFGMSEVQPCSSGTDGRDRGEVHTELSRDILTQFGKRAIVDLARKFIGKVCSAVAESSIAFAIGNILRSRSIFEVAQSAVVSNVVSMPDFLSLRNGTDESQHRELMDEGVMRFSISAQTDARIALTENWCHEASGEVDAMSAGGVPVAVGIDRRAPPACDNARFAVDTTVVGDQIVRKVCDFFPDFVTVLGVEDDGHVMETFCLTVEGNHNMFVGTGRELYLVSNCDDLHNIKEGESEKVREETVRWFREAMSNRLNDMVSGVIIIIMQRVHADDVSGAALADGGYEHLCIPMEFDPARRCETSIGWCDPRTYAGECFWPERFPPKAVELCKAQGPFAWASQYQQTPEMRVGGLLPRASWRTWDKPRFPRLDFVLVSLDPAFTKQDTNDPSGLTVWGCFRTPEGGRGAILLHAWRRWLELHGPDCEREDRETWDDFRARTSHQWGLVEHTADACKRFGADVLLVEAKASGHTVAQEMARLHRNEKWRVQLIDPQGLDKQARARRVQGEFSGGLIYAPARPWATMVIDECAQFPRGKHDDLVDSTTQSIWWLKQSRFIQRRSDYIADEETLRENALKRGNEEPLYPI